MPECKLDEYGTFCLTHKCGAFEANCRQDDCPHCGFFKPNYNELGQKEISRTVLSQLDDGLIERDCV